LTPESQHHANDAGPAQQGGKQSDQHAFYERRRFLGLFEEFIDIGIPVAHTAYRKSSFLIA
jgi:hypothetical protein